MSALQAGERDALRDLVREVLREVVPGKRAQAAPAAAEAPRVEAVSISSDGELQAFVQRLLDLFADPGGRAALRSGCHGFRLANGGATGSRVPDAAAPALGSTARIDSGVLSESKVIGLARSGRGIVLGKRVVVTPLARDKARQLGVKLERET